MPIPTQGGTRPLNPPVPHALPVARLADDDDDQPRKPDISPMVAWGIVLLCLGLAVAFLCMLAIDTTEYVGYGSTKVRTYNLTAAVNKIVGVMIGVGVAIIGGVWIVCGRKAGG